MPLRQVRNSERSRKCLRNFRGRWKPRHHSKPGPRYRLPRLGCSFLRQFVGHHLLSSRWRGRTVYYLKIRSITSEQTIGPTQTPFIHCANVIADISFCGSAGISSAAAFACRRQVVDVQDNATSPEANICRCCGVIQLCCRGPSGR